MNKQDMNGVRTAQDLERKYDLGSIGTLKKNFELHKDSLTKVENELSEFVKATTKNLEDIQDQVDGKITTWFSSGVPQLDNYPANEWDTDELKNNHLGDTYYDQDTGYAYRFAKSNDEYVWQKIDDSDVTEALAIANAAKDTADRKRQVFIEQPLPPYDVGDLWIKNEELYRCQTTKAEGEMFEENDWIKATKYTDDTVANQVGNKLTILSGTVTEIRDDVDELTKTMTNTTELVDEQGNKIGTLETKQSETSQTVDEISQTVSETTKEQNQKISQVTQTVEELNSKISGIADITTSKDDVDAEVEFENINQSEPIRIVIRPVGESISYLYPHDNLYPSDDLFLKVRTLRFENINTNEFFDYELPADLLYYDSENYDEFILDYDAQSCVINKKVGYNSDGTTYVLENEKTLDFEYPKINLTDGDYRVYVLGYDTAYIFVRLMAQNIYTKQFATKIKVSSEISQTASEINLEVSKKVGKDEVISRINQSAEGITIQANKVNISGVITAINDNTTTTIDGDKISTGSITANQIAANTINASKVASDVITTNNFSAQKINANNINAGTIDASKILVTNLNASNISSGTISTDRLSSNVITTSNFSAQNINANKITSGTISTNRLESKVITTDNFSAQKINANNITSGTLTADKINGGTITASAINLGGGTFTANTSGTIRAVSGSIGGFTIDGTSGLAGSYGTIRPNGNLLLYPNYGSARYVLSSAMTFNAQTGVIIASNCNGNMPAPSANIDLKACSGASVYLGCMETADGINERSSVTCRNGELRLKSAGAIYANGVAIGGSSSKATKENITELTQEQKDEVYELIKNIPLKQYDYKEQYGKPFNYGFLIEDIENTKLNNLLHITQSDINEDIKAYCSEDLTRLNLIMIKELMNKVETLENKIKELESDK